MSRDVERTVLAVLAEYGSLSSIEIMSLTRIPDEEVREAIDSLASQRLVSIQETSTAGNLAVTIQTKGLGTSSQFSRAL